MGNEINGENNEPIEKNINIKAPDFYINENYPIHGNETLKEIISNYIEGKTYSFRINNNYIEEDNLLTPRFNTKSNTKIVDNFSMFAKNYNKINNFENEKKKQSPGNNLINSNEINENSENSYQGNNIKNNIINNNKQIVESGINNKNININININIDIPKIKNKSIIKALNQSSKENDFKNEKLYEQENSDKNSFDSKKRIKNEELSKISFNNEENSEKKIFENKDSKIKTEELNPLFPRKTSKEMRNEIRQIKMKASSLMEDIRKEYKFLKTLGGGHFGTVRKAHRRSEKEPNQYFAIKSISIKNLTPKDYNDLVKEVDIISGLDHPNIIKFYETYHDQFYFHIVMELCQGKEVFDKIANNGYMPEKKVVNIIFKVLLAIAHCHSRGITHRDLKPENILFESLKPDSEIKLIDFGLSRKYAKNEKMHTILGTPYYVAPEVLKGEYDEKCDIWSIGAMTYLMLCGDPPFTGNSNNDIFKKILKNDLRFNPYKWKNISNSAKDFVKLCLNKNASERPSASKAVDHPWFNNVVKETHNLKNLPKNILINIKNFDIVDKFKQMIIKYLINRMNGDEINIYKKSFYALNYYHNGWIEPSELKKGFKLANIDITDEEIKYLYSIIIQPHKGGMDYSEFLMAGFDKNVLLTKDNIEKAFNYFDINKSGYIEYEDLKEVFLKMGRECIESDGINSIIHDAIENLKKGNEDKKEDTDSDFFDDEIKEKKNDIYKISKKAFFKLFFSE